MKRALSALALALGIVKLGAPACGGVALVASAHRAPHVLVGAPKQGRRLSAKEADERLEARPLEERRAPAEPAVTAATPAAPQEVHPFDAARARIALARSMESLPICRRGDASGPGVAEITWASDGAVARVALSQPYAASAARGCVARRFEQAAVPPYDGPPQAMRVRFSL